MIKSIHLNQLRFKNKAMCTPRRYSTFHIFRGSFLACITVTVFLIGEIPMFYFNLVNLLQQILAGESEREQEKYLFYQIAVRILDLTACSNLFLYFFFGSKFRQRMKSLFIRGRSKARTRFVLYHARSEPRIHTSLVSFKSSNLIEVASSCWQFTFYKEYISLFP